MASPLTPSVPASIGTISTDLQISPEIAGDLRAALQTVQAFAQAGNPFAQVTLAELSGLDDATLRAQFAAVYRHGTQLLDELRKISVEWRDTAPAAAAHHAELLETARLRRPGRELAVPGPAAVQTSIPGEQPRVVPSRALRHRWRTLPHRTLEWCRPLARRVVTSGWLGIIGISLVLAAVGAGVLVGVWTLVEGLVGS